MRNRQQLTPAKLISFFTIVIFYCTGSYAQLSSGGNGEITIAIRDQLGFIVKSSNITLSADRRPDITTVATDARGLAKIDNLSDGTYFLTIESEGFQKYKSEKITIKNGNKLSLTVTLQVAEIEAAVTVDGNNNDSADPERFGATRNLTDKEIENLPENPEELERALKELAGSGIMGGELPISVNGLPGGRLPPKSAIRQIRINGNVFSAQYEGTSGGGIEIFTKAEMAKFSGGVSFSGSDSRLNAASPFLGYRIPGQSRSYSVFLQGPLLPKRASFIFEFRRSEADRNSTINAIVLDSQFTPQNQRNFFPNTYGASFFNGRLDYDISQKHKLYSNLEYEKTTEIGLGVGSLRLPSMAYDGRGRNFIFQLAETSLINKSVVNQTRFQFSSRTLNQNGQNNDLITDVQGAFLIGGAQLDSGNSNTRFEILNDTTWQMKRYAMYFGGRLRGVLLNDDSLSNTGGRYIFSGGIAPALDAANNIVVDASGGITTAFINSLERYRRTLLFRSLGYSSAQIRERGGGASQFSLEGGESRAKISQFDVALYFQNSLNVRRDMSLSFGLRYENQTNIRSRLNFAPRVGIIWAPGVNQKSQKALTAYPRISIGFGVFYQRVGEQYSLDEARFNIRSQYIVNDVNILDSYPQSPSISNLSGASLPTTRRILDSRIQAPYQTLFNINFDKRLPTNISLIVSATYSKTTHALRSRNINPFLNSAINSAPAFTGSQPGIGNIYQTESSGTVKNKVLVASLKIPKIKYAPLQINYIWRNTRDNLVSGSGSPFNAYDFSNEFSASDTDIRHSLFINAQSFLPFKIRISNTLNIHSGLPYNVTLGRDINGDGIFLDRPGFATPGDREGLISTRRGVFDLSPSPDSRIIPRNHLRAAGIFVLDTYLSRTFKFTKSNTDTDKRSYSMTIGIRLNNILNTVNKDVPIGNVSSPYFLESVSLPRASSLSGSAGPRRLSFSIGFSF